jgi:hypothetical protein
VSQRVDEHDGKIGLTDTDVLHHRGEILCDGKTSQHCKKNEQILSFHDGCALLFCDSSIIDANLRTNTLFSLFCSDYFYTGSFPMELGGEYTFCWWRYGRRTGCWGMQLSVPLYIAGGICYL